MDVRTLRLSVILSVLICFGCTGSGGNTATDQGASAAGTEKTDKPQQDKAESPDAGAKEKEKEKEKEKSDAGQKAEEPARDKDKSEAKEEEKKERLAPTHDHKAFKERLKERQEMVSTQIQRYKVKDEKALAAMRTVPRHAFVRPGDTSLAYADRPLPIGYGQTISQPFIVGYMTDKMQLDDKKKVLEIGTGSAYQAAVAAEIAYEVYSIEILRPLGNSAQKRLADLGYRNVTTKVGDGYFGWEEHGPFDAIIVTAAAPHIPPPLVKQLKPGGRMIIPVGGPFATQYLILVLKGADGKVTSRQLLPVAFVPFTRKQ